MTIKPRVRIENLTEPGGPVVVLEAMDGSQAPRALKPGEAIEIGSLDYDTLALVNGIELKAALCEGNEAADRQRDADEALTRFMSSQQDAAINRAVEAAGVGRDLAERVSRAVLDALETQGLIQR